MPPEAGEYELRMCQEPPANLGIAPPAPGVLYEGPHGPAWFDLPDHRVRVRGGVSATFEETVFDQRKAVRGDGLPVVAEGRRLLMRRRGSGLRRGGRTIVVLDADRELASFRLRGGSTVSMERADGTVISEIPKTAPGSGMLVADASPLEVALLVAFSSSTMGLDLGLEVPHF